MSNYTLGVDIGYGQDTTMYCISKKPNRFMRWLNNRLGRADRWKIIYCGDNPAQIHRWRYRRATKIMEK